MHTEFRAALIPPAFPNDVRSLLSFDRQIFSAADRFTAAHWREYTAFWMLVDHKKVGCCAFMHHVDFREDREDYNPPKRGSLYITTTGIHPKYQGLGYGQLLKAWEIAYAYRHGFTRIITNTRKNNTRMIELNQQFGFRRVRTTPNYYAEPTDSTVVMELKL